MKTHFDFQHKLAVLLLFSLSSSLNIIAQRICYNYKGSWSAWENASGKVYRYNDLSGYILTTSGGIEVFSFRITNYKQPTKKEIKQHYKTSTWYEYTGTVEYYVNDQLPTANDIAKSCYLVYPNPRIDETPNVKRTCTAKIKVAPYKQAPVCYNIWFDGIGVGFDVAGLNFNK